MSDLPPMDDVAVVQELDEAPDADQASLAAWVTQTCAARSVEVWWVGLGVEIPDGATLRWRGRPCMARPVVELSAVSEGRHLGTWRVRPSLAITVTGPVAPRAIRAGERFVPEPGAIELAAVAPLAGDGPLIATRALDAGEPVTSRSARPAPDAAHGAHVDVVVTRGPVRVAAPAELLEDAFVGAEVMVRNHATGAVQRGILVDSSTVELP